jgi:hypothetical protein
MEEIEKLYSVLIDKKLYSKSLEDFQVQFADPEYVDKVYNVVTDKKLYSKDKETFTNQYSLKKKVNGKPTVLESGDGGLDLSTGRKIDTLSIQIADLEKQIQTEAETPLTEEEEKLYPLGKPAEKTPAMIKLESLIEQRDALKNTTEVTATKEEAVEALFDEGIMSPTQSQIIKKLDEVSQNKIPTTQLDEVVITQGEESDKSLDAITPELLSRGESYIVPELNYLFNDKGIYFEEADALGKKIKVTTESGKSEKIPLGNFENIEERTEELKNFIKENQEESFSLRRKLYGYKKNKIKFQNDKDYKQTQKEFVDEYNVLEEGYNTYLKNEEILNREVEAIKMMNDEQKINNIEKINELQNRIDEHNKTRLNLEKASEAFTNREALLNKATAQYFLMKQKQGALGRLGIKQILSGYTRMSSEYAQAVPEFVMNVLPFEISIGPEVYKKELLRYAKEYGYSLPANQESLTIEELRELLDKDSDRTRTVSKSQFGIGTTEEETMSMIDVIDAKIKDDGLKQSGEISDLIRTDVLEKWSNKSVSEQYEDLKKSSFWGGAIYGLAESLPALLTPTGKAGSLISKAGNFQRVANLVTLTSSFIDEEIANNPEFKDISENEKAILKAFVAWPSALLENFGFRNILAQKGILQGLLLKALDKTPKGASTRTFREIVLKEISGKTFAGRAARAGLFVGSGAAAEFETGFLQEFSETFVKQVYNDLKEKDFFETPESGTELLGNMLYSGAQEAVGGFILSVPSSVSAAYSTNSFNELSEIQARIFMAIKDNPEISQEALENKLKIDLELGKITEQQKKQIANDYQLAIGLANSIPTQDLSMSQFLEAMNLLVKEKKLEDVLDRKNESLTKTENEELQQVKVGLENIRQGKTTTKSEESLDEIFLEPEPETKMSALEVFFSKTLPEAVESLAPNLVLNLQNQTQGLNEFQIKTRNKIKDMAIKGANSISKLLPDTKIIVHESNSEFEKYAPAGAGYFSENENTIHVNLDKANMKTVGHELFHAVIFNLLGASPEAGKLATKMMNSVLKSLPKNSELAKRIEKFIADYDGTPDFKNEERLSELLGIMSNEQYTKLDKPQKNIIIKFLQDLAKALGFNFGSEFSKEDADVIDLLNTLAGKIATGEEITEADVEIIEEQSDLDKEQEQGEGGQVGTFTFPTSGKQQKAPSVKTDTRSFSSLITDKSLQDFKNQKFVTNMYDFTSAGPTEIAPGIVLDLYGGKSYVPLMMEKQGLNIGDFSNLAAFNTDANAQTFKRNVEQGDVSLFAPHVGTLEKSWQFQQNIFEQLTFAALDNNILTNEELITLFNSALISIAGKKALKVFNKNSNLNIKDFNSFKDNPKELVELLDIKNNYSPELRKLFNDRYSGNAKYKDALNVNNKIDFVKKFQDPLNVGSNSFDLISVIQFDNKNLQITKPNVGDVDYHPSFAYTIKANIEGIHQPDLFYQSSNVTDIYTKYTKTGSTVSVKEEVGEESFKQSNVASQSGSIPKVATIKNPKGKQQKSSSGKSDIQKLAEMFNMNPSNGFIPAISNEYDLSRMAKPLGYVVRRARYDEYGRGGGMRLYPVNGGPYYKPPPQGKQQKVFAKDRVPKNLRNDSYYLQKVDEARALGIPDSEIYDFLNRKEKLTVQKIKTLFKIDSILLGVLPESFRNIEGGANAGLDLFLDVEKTYQDLKRKNKKLAEPLTNTEIVDKVFEEFQKTPAYIKLADKTKMSSLQAKILSDLQKVLEVKPSENIVFQLRNAMFALSQQTKGVKDVKKLQQALINFMRRNLPKVDFSKSETLNLIRKIQAVNPKTTQNNLNNLMQDVLDITVAKNNEILLGEIKKILNRKFTTNVAGVKKGKGVDVIAADRIKRIKSFLLNDKSSVDNVKKQRLFLAKKLSELESKEDLTQEMIDEINDIEIAQNYNSAINSFDDDVSRTQDLALALEGLEVIIKGGSAALKAQIAEDKKTYRFNFAKAYKEITGRSIDMTDPNYKQQLEDRQNTRENLKKKKYAQKQIRLFIDNLIQKIDNKLFGTAEALDGLMDRISKSSGELFGGWLQEYVTNGFDASSRKYKGRMLSFEALLESTLELYYGKKWKTLYRKFQQETNTFYYDINAVNKARKAVEENNTLENQKILSDVLLAKSLQLSQHQMAYYVGQYKDPAIHPTFEKMFGPNYDETMQQMEKELDPRVEAFMNWQIEVYYPSVYPYYNQVYKKIYRTNIPYNRFYSGPLRRQGENIENPGVNLLSDRKSFNTAITSNYTKEKVSNTNVIKITNMVDNMYNYTRDMEYFAAYAEHVRNVDKIFQNEYIKSAIADIYGEEINTYIKAMLEKFATRGVSKATSLSGSFVNTMNTMFLVSRLGLNPSIAIKQLTSIPTYSADIGFRNWLKYSFKNKTQMLKLWKEMSENSIYLQDRGAKKITKTLEAYNPEGYTDFLPTRGKNISNEVINVAMYLIKMGDRSAILIGGMANYSYYKAQFKKDNPNASEQEAIDYAIIKFEKDTKRTQQSQDLQDKDFYQNNDPFVRAFNMFLTTPKQYLRKEIIATRNLYRKIAAGDVNAGKGTVWQNLRLYAMYHFFMPVMFQYVSLGFPGFLTDYDDEDKFDLMRAAVLGNLNGLFLFGDILQTVSDVFADKPYAGNFPSLPIFETILTPLYMYQRASRTKDPIKRAEAQQKALFKLMDGTGLPFSTSKRYFDNLEKVFNGETKNFNENILRLINYSDYQIEGGSKKKVKKRKKFSAKKNSSDFYDFDFDTDSDFDFNLDEIFD